jgi:hypoxanthine-DNA glycosylase
MIETHPFENFIPPNIKCLLLGSFTANSVTKEANYDWYYGSKRNQFWSIIQEVYKVQLNNTATKKNLFTKLGIGIADIIYQCERSQGNSLDSNLVNFVYNPFLVDILQSKKIETVFFSSRFVEKLYKKVFKNLVEELSNMELITLPSPSPRYALMSKLQKVERYRQLLPQLSISTQIGQWSEP